MAKRGNLTGTRSDNKREKSGGMDIIGATFSPDVQLAQKQLTSLGYSPGPIDGLMGDKTRQAIVAFQKKEGLTADGVLGNQTKAKLAAHTSTTAPLAGQNPGVTSDVLSQLQKDIDSYVTPSVPLTPTTDFPGVPGGGWTSPPGTPGATSMPAVPGAPPVAMPPVALPPQLQPGLVPGTQQAQVPVEEKIFGLPKKVVIGGGIAAGSLALVGLLYMLLRKKSEDDAQTIRTASLAERYESYTDRDGEQWGMRDGIVFRPSMSLSERVRRSPSRHR